jgi:hypothetical protein
MAVSHSITRCGGVIEPFLALATLVAGDGRLHATELNVWPETIATSPSESAMRRRISCLDVRPVLAGIGNEQLPHAASRELSPRLNVFTSAIALGSM